MKFRLGCTFSHYGKEEDIKRKNFIIDVTEFIGTEDEHHSGIFEVTIKLTKKESKKQVNLVEKVKTYLKENDLVGECYTVSHKGVILFTEEHINKY